MGEKLENRPKSVDGVVYDIKRKAAPDEAAGPYLSITARGYTGIIILAGMAAGTAAWGIMLYNLVLWAF